MVCLPIPPRGQRKSGEILHALQCARPSATASLHFVHFGISLGFGGASVVAGTGVGTAGTVAAGALCGAVPLGVGMSFGGQLDELSLAAR